jgi:hypothetical protein
VVNCKTTTGLVRISFFFLISFATSYSTFTRCFKYDRDDLCVNMSQFVPVIFEPPCIILVRYCLRLLVFKPLSGYRCMSVEFLHLCCPVEAQTTRWSNLSATSYTKCLNGSRFRKIILKLNSPEDVNRSEGNKYGEECTFLTSNIISELDLKGRNCTTGLSTFHPYLTT